MRKGARRRLLVAMTVLAGACAPGALSAQPAEPREVDQPSISKGLKLVTLAGSFHYERFDGGDQAARMNWVLGVTYLLTDSFALSPGISTVTDWETETDTDTRAELTLSPIFYLPGNRSFRPYVGARVGVGSAGLGSDDGSMSLGGAIGVVKIVGSRGRGAGFGAEVAYIASRSDGETDHNVVFALGVNVYFH